MFEIKVEVEFPAGHQLINYSGNCARLHGHNWVLEVYARARKLDSVGMALDFRSLKGAAQEVVAGWDHQHLNDLPDFKGINPTAENIAQIAYERLSAIIDGEDAWIEKVTVWENRRCAASYWDERKRREQASRPQ